MIRSRQLLLTAALVVCATIGIGKSEGLAGDSWNLLAPELEGRSREASAELFRSAGSIFEGLAQIELRTPQGARPRFQDAQKRLTGAADSLASLAKEKAAQRPLIDKELQPDERMRLANWYARATNFKEKPNPNELSKLTTAQLLNAAASEATRISKTLQELYGGSELRDNPRNAGTIIREISEFLYVGTIATRAFER